jgi:hypothetical protein
LKYIFFILLPFSLFWAGCSIIKPAPEAIPTYVHIDSFNFLSYPNEYSLAGSLSHNIGSAFVFFNGQAVGNFDLPATFPVIATGTGILEVEPGISVNGIEDEQSVYPFYTIDTLTLVPDPGKIITHESSTEYITALTMPFNADFEEGNVFQLVDGDSAMRQITLSNSPASMIFEGHGSGYIGLSVPGDSSINAAQKSFTVPTTNGVGTPFLEFNYKNTMPFYVGLVAVQGSTITTTTVITSSAYYLTGVYPSSTWQKFYLQLADFVATYPATSYYVVIKATLPANQTSGYVLFDNIKVITNPD